MHNNIALHLLNTIVHPPPNTYLYTHLCAIWTRCHVIGCLHNARLTAWIMNLDNSWLIAPAVNNFFHDNNYRGPSHFLRCTEQDRCPKLFSEASVCIRMALCHDAFDTQWYIFCQLCLEAAQRRHTNEFMDWGSDAWTARWTDGRTNQSHESWNSPKRITFYSFFSFPELFSLISFFQSSSVVFNSSHWWLL